MAQDATLEEVINSIKVIDSKIGNDISVGRR